MKGGNGALATLHPAYFALVMATGIVSIACALLGFHRHDAMQDALPTRLVIVRQNA